MKIDVVREVFTDKSTIGSLYLDGVFICNTLEDRVREGRKEYGTTAIPYGYYRVKITYSQKYKQNMPQIMDVPDFTGVRIHSGNKPEDTEGCILVGTYDPAKPDWISASRAAYNSLFPKLKNTSEIITLCISKVNQ